MTREAVTVAGTGETNEAAREEVTVPGLSAAAHRLTGYSQLWSCGGRGMASHHRATCHHPAVNCQSIRQLIASNTENDRRLPRSRHAGLQPCMFGCSVGYILLTLSSLAVYFNFITTLYGANEAWIHRPSTSAKNQRI